MEEDLSRPARHRCFHAQSHIPKLHKAFVIQNQRGEGLLQEEQPGRGPPDEERTRGLHYVAARDGAKVVFDFHVL